MRNSFIETLVENHNKYDFYFLTGDLGYGAVEPVEKVLGSRFLNLGITEQAIAGIAAGIASEKRRVFFYSIANFSTFRCAEQIRNDIDYHKLNVTIVSVGGGLAYGSLGYSHHAVQDYALIRSFVNMIIYAPSDPHETSICSVDILKSQGPSYLRLGKTGERNLSGSWELVITQGYGYRFKRNNSKSLLISTGTALQYFNDDSFDVISLFKWGLEFAAFEDIISKYDEVIVLENHYKSGGLFSWFLENLRADFRGKLVSHAIAKSTYNNVQSEVAYFDSYFKGN